MEFGHGFSQLSSWPGSTGFQSAGVKSSVQLADKDYAAWRLASSLRREKSMFWAGVFLGLLIGANIGVILACKLGAVKRREMIHNGIMISESPMDYAGLEDSDENSPNRPIHPEPSTYLDRYPHA
jgi:hypothetical protein